MVLVYQSCIKARLYLSGTQERLFSQYSGNARSVFNAYTDYRDNEYKSGIRKKADGKLSFSQLRSLLTVEAKTEKEWLKLSPAATLQSAIKQADDAYKAMVDKRKSGKKASVPHRSKKDTQSIRYPDSAGFEVKRTHPTKGRGKVHASKLGWMKFKGGEFPENPSSITISRDKSGAYWISFTVWKVFEPQVRTGAIALDLGLSELIHYSVNTGDRGVVPVLDDEKYEKKNRNAHRNHSRKEKKSKNREKARVKLAKSYRKLSHVKGDYYHKVANSIVSNNHAIIAESLSIHNMKQNRKLAPKIHKVSWGLLLTAIRSECSKQGVEFIALPRFTAGTQECSHCHALTGPKGLDGLSIREWECFECHTIHHRDFNSTVNHFDAAGLAESLNACGVGVRELLDRPVSSSAPALNQEPSSYP